ncbi:MAG: hypothetical protein MI919_27175, partial [Holophagales bacterium]|nr:hypothetical protein [Holophagales bacterium]
MSSERQRSPRAATGTPGPRLFVAAMVLMIGLPPLIQAALDVGREGRPIALELFTTPVSREAFRAFESRMEERFFLGRLAHWQWAPRIDGALERGGRRVVFGRGGWLFYRPALHFVSGTGFGHLPSVSPANALSPRAERIHRAVADLHRQLEARGKRLLFVPVPTKPTVVPERASRWAEPPAGPADAPSDPEVARLLAALRRSAVEVVDPLPVLLEAKAEGAEVFLPADTHWSWAGMLRVARQVAAEMAPPRDPGRGPAYDQRRVRIEADGDLYRMLGYPRRFVTGELRPRPPMDFEIWQVATTRDGEPPVKRGASVLVIGDSSALVFSEPSLGLGRRAGFAERLAFA